MIRLESKAFLITFFMAIGFLLVDSIVDNLLFINKPIIDQLLFKMATAETLTRLTSVLFILLFSFILSKYSIKLNESEGRYRQLFDNLEDPVFVQVFSGGQPASFVDANRAAFARLGYTREELLQLKSTDILSLEKPETLSALRQTLLKMKHITFEADLTTKSGDKIPVEIDAHLCTFDPQAKFMWKARDLTRRKRTEEALRQAHEELKTRMERRTAELAQARSDFKEERKQAETVLAESARQLRIMTGRLLDAQENERRRLSLEIHDELGQALILLKFKINALSSKLEPDSPLKPDCKVLLAYIDSIIENVRRISRDLSPTIVEELGLSAALRHLCEEFGEHYEPGWCTIETSDIDALFPRQTQISVYRIFQEIFTNIVKHARTSRVEVDIKIQDDYVNFNVQDFGRGFDTEQALTGKARAKGTGIAAMQERVRMMGGTFNIGSASGEGTSIAFSLPIQRSFLENGAL